MKDVNDHAPEFSQPWYTFDVQEGRAIMIVVIGIVLLMSKSIARKKFFFGKI